ncbi:glycogen debranching protein GlgX [Siccirubricoccus sp. KC 17139]|uniref:Glycogen debranching protein GlgX n=1 Tax=Siccirubricoccus soli TaxID=2899147 RepID=A0ABT1D885_9PROT|nr:glycogen debranching protein GlgX [Siccirubricoccus soli]MCO6418151.1 glycogen debranching protein GlgX [Siccirubricoccus soli]MCP2684286.1 glycogen debranching protein GlgX [Siccirubricoccus soli]
MPPIPSRLAPGRPDPLGATWDGLGVNFAVFSANAERIDLCLFDAAGRKEIARLPLPECTDEIWHGYLPEARPGQLYGYRAYGPYEPRQGHRFNPNKLLLDPYAKQLAGEVRWSDVLFGYRVGANRADLSFDRRDSAPAMPKAVVVDDSFAWGDDRSPCTPWDRTVIYEAHVRGLTMQRDEIPPRERGTFSALADPRVIDHLLRTGVTAIELLPIHAFLQDRFLVSKGLKNYWGYSTLAFFAPEPRYLIEQWMRNELKVAIRRLHAAGLEVILDVVYNHTCEGSEMGPTLSWRGFDNASYYRLMPGEERYLINDTGTGNTLNISHPRVLQMVMDSLRYWVTEYHVDGFRFDLGTILGREPGGFDPNGGFFDAVRQDPVLAKVKLISEPWDIGPGGYQVGNHPPGFAEWNDKYRDAIRRFWKGDAGMRAEIAARLTGSAELFDRRRRRPWASVNYISSHDGYTLHDLTTYEQRHNEANGEDNRDGHSDNQSCNWGAEGETDDPEINAIRRGVTRAMLATLFASAGTPMLQAGDEAMRTQQGNNNAYCQDNAISWFDWERANTEEAQALQRFVTRVTGLRQRLPPLRPSVFLHGGQEVAPGLSDIAWFDQHGQPMTSEAWGEPEARTLVLRRAVGDAEGPVDITLLLLNADSAPQEFTLPEPAYAWRKELDSAEPEAEVAPVEGTVTVAARSVVLLAARLEREGQ